MHSTDNAEAAIRLLEPHTDIHVIFTDIELSGSMDSMKLAALMRTQWPPPIEIIVTSGRHKIADFHLPDRGVFFEKPYDLAVMQRLGGGSGAV